MAVESRRQFLKDAAALLVLGPIAAALTRSQPSTTSIDNIVDKNLGAGYESPVFLNGKSVKLQVFGTDQGKATSVIGAFPLEWARLSGLVGADDMPYQVLSLVENADHPSVQVSPQDGWRAVIHENSNSQVHMRLNAMDVVVAKNGAITFVSSTVMGEAVANYYNSIFLGGGSEMLNESTKKADAEFNQKVKKTDVLPPISGQDYKEIMSVAIRAIARLRVFTEQNGRPLFLSQLFHEARGRAVESGKTVSTDEILQIAKSLWPEFASRLDEETVLFLKTDWENRTGND